jgi:hypothetical protein
VQGYRAIANNTNGGFDPRASAAKDEDALSPSRYPSDRLVSAEKEGRHETSAVQ